MNSARRHGSRNSPLCPYCGYCQRGIESDRCPECGNAIPTNIDLLLCWERREYGSFLAAFFGTIIEVVFRPRRVIRNLQLRSDYPIIRPRAFLISFIGVVLGVFVGGVILEILVYSLWNTGSATRAFITLWRWLRHLDGTGVIGQLPSFSPFVVLAFVGLPTLVVARKLSGNTRIRVAGLCILGASFLLPLLLLQVIFEAIALALVGPVCLVFIINATLFAGVIGFLVLGHAACDIRLATMVVWCAVYALSCYQLNGFIILSLGRVSL